jgi:hypothetical protein
VSKSSKAGFRGAATYKELHGLFKTQETEANANVQGQKYRDMYKTLEKADARRRRWAWLRRWYKGAGSTIVGLVWMALVLGAVIAGGYYAWIKYLR